MKRAWLGACLPLVVLACGAEAPPPQPPAPLPVEAGVFAPKPRLGPALAAKHPVTHTYFGLTVVDDYEWLEDAKSLETQAFIDVQAAHARTTLDAYPDRSAIRARVATLLGQSSPDFLTVEHAGRMLFVLVSQPPKPQAVLTTRNENADATSEHVVLDPQVLDPTGKTTIDWFVPSPDGNTVAISLSKNGSESGDVHFVDTASGQDKGEVIAHVQNGTAGGSVAWNENATGVWYTRYPKLGERPEADTQFYQQVYYHKLGAPEIRDTYAIGREFPRIAEVKLDRSADGKAILATVENGDSGDFEHHVLVNGKWKRLTHFDDGLTTATFGPDGKLYVVSRKDAPRGKVVSFAPPFDKQTELLPQGDAVIESIAVTKSTLYSIEVVGGPSRIRRIPLDGKPEPLAAEPTKVKGSKPGKPSPTSTIANGERGVPAAELPILPVSSVSDVVRLGDDLLVRNVSYLDAPAWYRYVAKEHRLVKTSMAKVAPADMSDVEVVRETCVSKDGTKVPMSVVRKRGSKLTGILPALLTGYGGFGNTRKPSFKAWWRVWLDQGGVVADANLRGGNEFGEPWHQAGQLTKKQNVFDDFAACAQALAANGYTSPEHLAILGGSNGGLLMGAEIVQHPKMARAVVAQVGIYDMLRNELTSNGSFNTVEYGTVKDEAALKALSAYSPFLNVKDGVAYPSVLFTTGANDPRVDPFHSRKMTARLQTATASENPILLRISNDTGHGMGTPLAAQIEETTDNVTFLFHELGVSFRHP